MNYVSMKQAKKMDEMVQDPAVWARPPRYSSFFSAGTTWFQQLKVIELLQLIRVLEGGMPVGLTSRSI